MMRGQQGCAYVNQLAAMVVEQKGVKRGSKPAHDTCLLHNRALSYFIVIIEPYGLNGICARQLSNNTPRSLPNWGTKRGQNFVLTLPPPRSPQNFTQRYISSLLIVLFTL